MLEKLLGGGLLGAAGNVIGTSIGAIAGASEAEKEREWNAEQAQINRDWQTAEREATQNWNLEQWNRENEYNTPEAQMKRMVAAGINPNQAAQAIGGNATSPGQVRSTAQSGAQAAPAPQFSNTLGNLLGNSLNTVWQNADKIADIVGKNITNKRLDKRLSLEEDEIKANIAKTGAETEYVKQDYERLKQMTPHMVQQAALGVSQTMMSIKLIKAQVDTENVKQDLIAEQTTTEQAKQDQIYQQIEEGKHRIMNLDADTSKKIAEAAKTWAEKNQVDVNVVLSTIEAEMKQRENEFQKQGVFYNVSSEVGGLLYSLQTGNDATAYYEPVLNYQDQLIKKGAKQQRRNAWNQMAANAVGSVVNGAVDIGKAWLAPQTMFQGKNGYSYFGTPIGHMNPNWNPFSR